MSSDNFDIESLEIREPPEPPKPRHIDLASEWAAAQEGSEDFSEPPRHNVPDDLRGSPHSNAEGVSEAQGDGRWSDSFTLKFDAQFNARNDNKTGDTGKENS